MIIPNSFSNKSSVLETSHSLKSVLWLVKEHNARKNTWISHCFVNKTYYYNDQKLDETNLCNIVLGI